MQTSAAFSWLPPVARAGLTAKGIVYCLVGILAFMAAFHLGGQSSSQADKQGVLNFINEQPAGKWLLLAIAAGLVCYSIWRFIQAFTYRRRNDSKAKKAGKQIRYLFSGLVYLSLAVGAFKMVMDSTDSGGGNSNETMAARLMQQPLGQWLVGLVALFIAGVGIYQFYYGLSEKYKKHLASMGGSSEASRLLLRSGKIGYVARGVVWLVIAWMLIRAALHANAAEAGDTAEAFRFLQGASYGSYLLGAVGLGLACYGLFNFIRARYESF